MMDIRPIISTLGMHDAAFLLMFNRLHTDADIYPGVMVPT